MINEKFGILASDEEIIKTIANLEKNGIKAFTVDTGFEAKEMAMSMLPEGAEVMTMTSVTLHELEIDVEIAQNPDFDSVKNKLSDLDSTLTEMGKKRLGAAHQWAMGSVHAVTHDGQLMIASATGSQLPSYAYGASNVIWIVGSQKLVKDINEGFQRINEYCFPLEDERAKKAYGIGSGVNKVLIINREVVPERLFVIIVKEKLGF